MATALEPYEGRQAGRRDRARPRTEAEAPPRKKRVAVWLGFVCGVAVLRLAVWLWNVLSSPKPGPDGPRGELPREKSPGEKPSDKKPSDGKLPSELTLPPRADDDKKLKTEAPAIVKGHTGAIRSVAFHPKDPNVLASASDDGTVRL